MMLIASFFNPISWIASAIASGVAIVMRDLGSVMEKNTMVTVGARYAALMRTGAGLAAWVGLSALLVAGARTALNHDAARLGHDVVRIVLAIVSGGLLVVGIPIAEMVVAAMSNAIASTFMGSGRGLAATIETTFGVVAAGNSPAIATVIGLGLLVGAILTWLVLIVAQGLVYIAAFFVPLAYVLSAKWGRRMLDLLITGLMIPFVLTGLFATSLAVVGDGSNIATQLEHDVLGVALLGLAAFSPITLLHLVRSGGDAVGRIRHPASHVQQAAGSTQRAASAMSVVGGAVGGAAGAAKTRASAATRRASTATQNGAAGGATPSAATLASDPPTRPAPAQHPGGQSGGAPPASGAERAAPSSPAAPAPPSAPTPRTDPPAPQRASNPNSKD